MKGLTPTELSQLTRKSFTLIESEWNGNQKSDLRHRVEKQILGMKRGERFTTKELAKLCKSRLERVRGVIYKLAYAGKVQRTDLGVWERV